MPPTARAPSWKKAAREGAGGGTQAAGGSRSHTKDALHAHGVAGRWGSGQDQEGAAEVSCSPHTARDRGLGAAHVGRVGLAGKRRGAHLRPPRCPHAARAPRRGRPDRDACVPSVVVFSQGNVSFRSSTSGLVHVLSVPRGSVGHVT